MAAKPKPTEEEPNVEHVLDLLAAILFDLRAIREKVDNRTDRAALNSQIGALAKWWRRIDDERAEVTDAEVESSAEELRNISAELKQEKKHLQNVSKVIHRAAQVIALAEKILKKLA